MAPEASTLHSLSVLGLLDRGDGSYTPVVALDELPPNIVIAGLPRTLSHDQIHGIPVIGKLQRRTHSAAVLHRGSNGRNGYVEPSPSASANAPSKVPDIAKLSIDSESRPDHSPTQEHALEPQSKTRTMVASKHSPYPTPRPLPPSGIEPDASKKTHCTHWLRTGNCGYLQQGCLYKHEIPGSKKEWEAVGFRTIPQWIHGKNAMRLKRMANAESMSVVQSSRRELAYTALNAINPLALHSRALQYRNINEESSDGKPAVVSQKAPEDDILTTGGDLLIELESPTCSRSPSPTAIKTVAPTNATSEPTVAASKDSSTAAPISSNKQQSSNAVQEHDPSTQSGTPTPRASPSQTATSDPRTVQYNGCFHGMPTGSSLELQAILAGTQYPISLPTGISLQLPNEYTVSLSDHSQSSAKHPGKQVHSDSSDHQSPRKTDRKPRAPGGARHARRKNTLSRRGVHSIAPVANLPPTPANSLPRSTGGLSKSRYAVPTTD